MNHSNYYPTYSQAVLAEHEAEERLRGLGYTKEKCTCDFGVREIGAIPGNTVTCFVCSGRGWSWIPPLTRTVPQVPTNNSQQMSTTPNNSSQQQQRPTDVRMTASEIADTNARFLRGEHLGRQSTDVDQLSDAQLNELFHVEVAGKCYIVPPEGRILLPASVLCPAYCTDANAVLPWFETVPFDVVATRSDTCCTWTVRLQGRFTSSKEFVGLDESFPRAAVLALLRAKRAEKAP